MMMNSINYDMNVNRGNEKRKGILIGIGATTAAFTTVIGAMKIYDMATKKNVSKKYELDDVIDDVIIDVLDDEEDDE